MKIELEVPDNMDANAAGQCLAMGMSVLSRAKNAGVCICEGAEENGRISVKMRCLRGEYAKALLLFCDGVGKLSGEDPEKALAAMRDSGAEILRRMESRRTQNGNRRDFRRPGWSVRGEGEP